MPLSVTHATAADGTFSAAGITNWDAAHTLTGIASAAQGGTGIAFFTAAGPTVARTYTFPDSDQTILYSGGALGTPSSGTLTNATGLPEAGLSLTDITTANASATAHGFVPKWPNNTTTFFRGDGTYAATPAGALSGITAATGTNTIASGDNDQIWNWAQTTNTTDAFKFGETSAATGGTITSGIPNQNLLRIATLAASTASPLRVDSRGSHVFSIGSTTAQILGTLGSGTVPLYSFAGQTNGGIWASSNQVFFGAGGKQCMSINGVGATGQARFGDNTLAWGNPQISEATAGTTGINVTGAGTPAVGFAISGVENSRIIAGIFQFSVGSADAVSYALNFRKSRGTVASPTVITTGDDLGTLDFFGYVGATNTYQSAVRIVADSTGTITDSATGIGGILRFLTAVAGAEPVEAMSVQAAGDVTLGLPSPATTVAVGFPQMPTMAGTPTGVPTVITGFTPFVYDTTGDKIWVYDYGAAAWKGVAVA